MRDSGPTALVTGASRGIGRHIAIGLARAGFNIGLVATDVDRLTQVATIIAGQTQGVKVAVIPFDVTDESAVQAGVRAAEAELGPIDTLVNNAGVVDDEVPPWKADPEQWWRTVEVHVRGPFLLQRALVPGMLKRGGGRIIDLSSGAGVRDAGMASGYNIAKTGLLRLGGALHNVGNAKGLRTFEIAPGVIDTDMTRSMPVHKDRTEWTSPALVVDLIVAAAKGEIDAWSGCYLRAGVDTPETLAEAGPTHDQQRRLRIIDGP